MWIDPTVRVLTTMLLWSTGLLLVDAGIRLLRVRAARARALALWAAYVSLVPGTIVSLWFRPGFSLLPAFATPAAPAVGTASAPAGAVAATGGFELLAVLVVAAALALGALGALRAWLGLRAARSDLTPCGDTRVESLLAQLKHDLGIRQGVQCCTRPGNGSPFSVGWRRPLVVIPESVLRRASAATLEHILTHELIHIRHADFVLNALQKLTRSLAWFNPLAHVYDARLDQWREVACDAGVLERGTISRGDYARTLLALTTAGPGGTPVASVALIRNHSNLKRRVSHMRIAQTRDRLLKRVLLGSLAAIPFVLISCSNSDVNGPEAADTAAKEALAAKDLPEGSVRFGDLHEREDGTKVMHFKAEDGSEGTVEFKWDVSLSDKELHFIRESVEAGEGGFGPAADPHTADPGHNVLFEKAPDFVEKDAD
jgi:beta-lactamase regulating signal transducer with metallopeptidase domain